MPRLRWLLFAALLFAAALPGIAVLALRATVHGRWSLMVLIALGAAVIFALLLLIAAILARAIVVPVERLSAATRALAQGRSAHLRPPTLEVREIRSLNADFTAMAEAINRRSRYRAISPPASATNSRRRSQGYAAGSSCCRTMGKG